MNCIRCELVRAKIAARIMLGMGYNGRHIAAKLSETLPGKYFVSYHNMTGTIKREGPKIGMAFEIVDFDKPIDRS